MAKRPTYEELEQRIKELEGESARRKEAEEALRESEERYRLVAENVSDVLWIRDMNLRFTYISSSVERLTGYSVGEAMALPMQKAYTSDSIAKALKALEEEFALEKDEQGNPSRVRNLEMEGYHKNGSIIWTESKMTLLRDSTGRASGILGVSRDITERKKMENAIIKAREDWERTFDALPDLIAILDKSHKIIRLNKAMAETLGVAPEAATGLTCYEHIHGTKEPPSFCPHVQLLMDGKGHSVEVRDERLGGDFLVSVSPIRDTEGHLTGSVHVARDITSRKRAEEALRESEVKYRLLVQNANDAIFIAQDGVLKFPNPMTEKMTGYSAEELSKLPFVNLLHPEDREMVIENYRKRLNGEPVPTIYSFRVISKAGNEIVVQPSAVVIIWEGRPATLNFVRDITEQRRLETQFHAAQRLESLGTLAGGIAHDFNNLLMGIQGETSLMLMDMDPSHSHFGPLEGIEDHVKSAADLSKQLLGFARGGKYEVKPTSLNEVLEKSSAMFARTKKEIRIHGKYQEGVWAVEVDRGQIQQVLMNLYVNAWQAMTGGGSLYLETQNVMLDEEYVKPFGVPPGRYVRMSVRDTGAGMDEEIKRRLFEPFFTTKGMSRGTGLGLASAYGIIKNHRGIIDVLSKKGEGSIFNVYLPASHKENIRIKESKENLLRGNETLLFVDDEEAVTDVGRQMLERLGYEVLIARGGGQAVELFKANESRIDLIILDMIMPDMGGADVYRRLKNINPNIKVLLSSGYSLRGQAQEILNRGCDGFIQKPFSLTELSEKLSEILKKK